MRITYSAACVYCLSFSTKNNWCEDYQYEILKWSEFLMKDNYLLDL